MVARARVPIRLFIICLISILIIPLSVAGEVQLSWNPSATATGYKVYRGTTSGSYGAPTDVGNVLTAPVSGLTDCTNWYFALKAYNAGGDSAFSTQLASWPRSVLTSANPASIARGSTTSVVVSGVNFGPGDVVTLSSTGVQVNSVTLNSCQQMTLALSVSPTAALGARNVVVTHSSGVAGTGVGLITVIAAIPPTVLATSPLDGATGVPLAVQPTVQFSEAVSGVNSSTLRLLNAQGAAVAQAAGSPALSAGNTVATIDPASDLQTGQTYRIQVVGGAGGVTDLDGNPLAVTYTQAPGFTTLGDTTAPTVSGLDANQITGTTAVVVWTTNEPADSQVFYRKQGGTLYQTVTNATDVTAHSVALGGLEPQTDYEYHVASTDAQNNTTTTSPDEAFTTGTSPFEYVRFEAEAGLLVAPVAATTGAGVFDGEWIATPPGTSQGSATSPAGSATFGVLLPDDGPWFLWVRMYGATTSQNTWFESIDGSTRQTLTVNALGAWTWVEGQAYDIAAGQHTVELGGREGGTRADRVLLTNDPNFVPNEVPDADVTATGPVTGFTATPSTGQIGLSWTNPSGADLDSVVIRYRTDGQYPTSPVDGLALVDAPAVPNAADAHSHTGVTPGTQYFYSAFAVDDSGNVSTSAHAQAGIAAAPPPPGNVTIF